jgi:uncharacterized protein
VRFRKGASLDPSQVEDRRGMPGGGLAVGGGGLGLVGLAVYLLVTLLSGGGTDLGPLGGLNGTVSQGQPLSACRKGAQANTRQECAVLADINSIQGFWKTRLTGYQKTQTVLFSGSTDSGCGPASTDVGPFYCPVDKLVYIDLEFFNELRTRFGAHGGPFAEAYVLAHEYGHHVQDLLGNLGQTSSGATGSSVRTELQADCYAGVWGRHATETGFIVGLTQADINDALDAAAAVGDDRIQSETQGQVNPETWTHGSSSQRKHWFTVGYKSGDPRRCDTFHGQI